MSPSAEDGVQLCCLKCSVAFVFLDAPFSRVFIPFRNMRETTFSVRPNNSRAHRGSSWFISCRRMFQIKIISRRMFQIWNCTVQISVVYQQTDMPRMYDAPSRRLQDFPGCVRNAIRCYSFVGGNSRTSVLYVRERSFGIPCETVSVLPCDV